MPHLSTFYVLIYAIVRQWIPALSSDLQQQEVNRQQRCAACQKPCRIDVPASLRVEFAVSVVNKSANVWQTNGRYNLYKGYG